MNQNKKPLVSVIVPCYNSADYIYTSIGSIISQDYQELEIICVDDGSDDDTLTCLRKLSEDDERIVVLQQKREYAGVARNKGLEAASGDYYIFLDSDDVFLPQMISKMVDCAERTGADVVLCDAYFQNCNTGEYSMPSYVINRSLVEKYSCFSYKDMPDNIFQVSLSVPWNKMLRADFIRRNNIRFQGTKRSNDEYFSAIAIMTAQLIAWVPDRMVIYRHANAKSLQGFSEDDISDDFYKAHLAIKETLSDQDKYEPVKRSFQNKVCSTCIAQLSKQATYRQYDAMYRLIKDVVVPTFFSTDEIACIKNSRLKLLMESSDSAEYLFEQLKKESELREAFLFPFNKLGFEDRNIALYGAGKMGQAYYRQLQKNTFYRIVCVYDRDYMIKKDNGMEITSPAEIGRVPFDRIVIAIDNSNVKNAVKEMLVNEYGIEVSKII